MVLYIVGINRYIMDFPIKSFNKFVKEDPNEFRKIICEY